jgi:hypothetical protein
MKEHRHITGVFFHHVLVAFIAAFRILVHFRIRHAPKKPVHSIYTEMAFLLCNRLISM